MCESLSLSPLSLFFEAIFSLISYISHALYFIAEKLKNVIQFLYDNEETIIKAHNSDIILPFFHSSILPYFHSSILPFFHSSILPFFHFSQHRSFGGRDISSRVGVSHLSFDREGVLLAACGSNGLLRIFDFDECLGAVISRHVRHSTHRNSIEFKK